MRPRTRGRAGDQLGTGQTMENKCSLLAVEAVRGLPLNRGVYNFKVFFPNIKKKYFLNALFDKDGSD